MTVNVGFLACVIVYLVHSTLGVEISDKCPTGDLDVGRPCEGKSNVLERRWYFDSKTCQCKSFDYLGCDGNENRFISLIECQKACNVLCPFGKALNNVSCSDTESCPSGFHCNTVDNETACCPDQLFICSQPKDDGEKCEDGKNERKVFYNDKANGVCKSMTYKGCAGNLNNFANLQECDEMCRPKCKEYLQKVYRDLNLNIKL